MQLLFFFFLLRQDSLCCPDWTQNFGAQVFLVLSLQVAGNIGVSHYTWLLLSVIQNHAKVAMQKIFQFLFLVKKNSSKSQHFTREPLCVGLNDQILDKTNRPKF